MEQYTTGEVTTGWVTVHGQLVIVRVVAWRVGLLLACILPSWSAKRVSGEAYLSHGVGLAVVDDRGGSRAEGGVGSENLSGVVDGRIAPSIGTSHEGGGSSDDGGGTHFC